MSKNILQGVEDTTGIAKQPSRIVWLFEFAARAFGGQASSKYACKSNLFKTSLKHTDGIAPLGMARIGLGYIKYTFKQ